MADYITQHHHVNPENYLSAVERLFMFNGWGNLPAIEDANIVGTVAARVNHGRWLMDCPSCTAAHVADFDYQVFMGVECGNAANDGKWFGVIFPANAEDIEAALLARPVGLNPARSPNRNWEITETVDDLLAQNSLNMGG